MIQESAVSYLDSSGNTLTGQECVLPKPPVEKFRINSTNLC